MRKNFQVMTFILFLSLRAHSAQPFDAIQDSLRSMDRYQTSETAVRLVKASKIADAPYTSLVRVANDSGVGIIIELRYGPEVEQNPTLLLKHLNMAHLLLGNETASSRFTPLFPHGKMVQYWSELSANAEAGSTVAKLRLGEIEADLVKNPHTQAARTLSQYFGAEKIQREAAEYQSRWGTEQAALTAQLEKEQKTKFADWNRLKAKNIDWKKFESLDLKLNDLVARNDRQGTADLIRAYLPWQLMEPTETSAWTTWLLAIEKPDPSQSVIVYRGVDYETDKVQSWTAPDGSKNIGFLSTVLTKNQGSYTRRLRSLQTSRELNADSAYKSGASSAFSGSISDTLVSHAKKAVASTYLSFSANIDVTEPFVGKLNKNPEKKTGGILAVRVDSRRMFANPFSVVTELEYLAPLIIFPDEVLSYHEFTPKDAFQFRRIAQLVLNEVYQKTGHDGAGAVYDARTIGQTFAREQNQFMAMLVHTSAGNQCRQLF